MLKTNLMEQLNEFDIVRLRLEVFLQDDIDRVLNEEEIICSN